MYETERTERKDKREILAPGFQNCAFHGGRAHVKTSGYNIIYQVCVARGQVWGGAGSAGKWNMVSVKVVIMVKLISQFFTLLPKSKY